MWRILYPFAWVRVRLPRKVTPSSKAWFTAKWEADWYRRKKKCNEEGSLEWLKELSESSGETSERSS